MMKPALEREFDEAMLDIYRRAKSEAGYNARIFIGMVVDNGGLHTARYLLHSATVSDGYTSLWQRGRLDLTVEAMILDAKWQSLFSPAELKIAVDRLQAYGYTGPIPNLPTTGTVPQP